jgi:hypothetical protein
MASPIVLLGDYANAPTNYFGTFLFLSYILAALCLSIFLLHQLYNKFSVKQARQSDNASQKRDILLFSALAAVSFSALSFNMVNVLTDSFLHWYSQTKWVRRRPPISETVPYLWPWMMESTLFTNFALDLVSTPETEFWSTIALLWTMGVSKYMAIEGRWQRDTILCHRESVFRRNSS